MTKQVEQEPEGKKNISHILFLAAALLLPAIFWVILGWASSLLPLIIYIFIQKYGWRYTNSHLAFAILAALLSGYLFGSIELTLFAIALVPAGYALAFSAQRQERPWIAGLRGTVILCISFFIFFSVLLINSEFTFFQALTQSLNRGVDEALLQYRKSDSLTAENYKIIEQTLYQVKSTAPLILPAILGSMLIMVTWTTLVLGNVVLPRLKVSKPFPEYRFWTLPDKLIWAVILFGLLTIITEGTARLVGINCLLLLALTYSFQGLAILVFMLKKWNVPLFFRSIIYIMMLLQSFGTVLLVIAGVADVWFDFRKLNPAVVSNNDTDL